MSKANGVYDTIIMWPPTKAASCTAIYSFVCRPVYTVRQKKVSPWRYFGNISSTTQNFYIKFYTPFVCSYLRKIAKFYSITSNFDKVMLPVPFTGWVETLKYCLDLRFLYFFYLAPPWKLHKDRLNYSDVTHLFSSCRQRITPSCGGVCTWWQMRYLTKKTLLRRIARGGLLVVLKTPSNA